MGVSKFPTWLFYKVNFIPYVCLITNQNTGKSSLVKLQKCHVSLIWIQYQCCKKNIVNDKCNEDKVFPCWSTPTRLSVYVLVTVLATTHGVKKHETIKINEALNRQCFQRVLFLFLKEKINQETKTTCYILRIWSVYTLKCLFHIWNKLPSS